MVQERLQQVFREVFQDDALIIEDEMDADDVEQWDSLTHISLIVEVEKAFETKFRNAEIARLQCIGDLKNLIVKHKPELAEA